MMAPALASPGPIATYWEPNSQPIPEAAVLSSSPGEAGAVPLVPIAAGRRGWGEGSGVVVERRGEPDAAFAFELEQAVPGLKSRVELSSCFATNRSLTKRGEDPGGTELAMSAALHWVGDRWCGGVWWDGPDASAPAEHTVRYEMRLPKDLPSSASFIAGQFHGRPDPRIFLDRGNRSHRLSTAEAYAACGGGGGWRCSEGRVSGGSHDGWRYKQGGYPPLSFLLAGARRAEAATWAVLARSDDRLFVPKADCGVDVRRDRGAVCPGAPHEKVAVPWSAPFAAVPLGEWLAFEWRVGWSAYAAAGGATLSNGSVALRVTSRATNATVAAVDWEGPLGRHDDGRSPYFKIGLYDPSGDTAPASVEFRRLVASSRPRLGDAPAPQCTYEAGVDYTPTMGGTVPAATREACCAACDAKPWCLAGVWQQKSGDCFLKGGIIVPHRGKPGIVSCRARADPVPAPPFDCAAPGADCAGRLGATLWNPCYYVNASLPVLLDGAAQLAGTGARVIKVALFEPKGNYPFNSPDWPDRGFPTSVAMAQHPYYRALWASRRGARATAAAADARPPQADPRFDTFVLVAYSTVGGTSGGGAGYWTGGITAAQEAEETAQFKACAAFLLAQYPGKTFVFENWEGDWASRAGSYDPKKPATPLALASMRRWLAARQAGVTAARAGYAPPAHRPPARVFFSAEVNLVHDSLTTGAPNMINEVIPYVPTDMVSYSSYDTESSPANFRAALAYLQRQHNRTAAAPPGPRAIFVAEYGMGENVAAATAVNFTIENVVNEALAFGAAYVLHWETFGNECTGGPGCQNNRCDDATQPVADPKRLHGFWLVRPDGTKAPAYHFLADKIARGSR